MTEPKPTYDLGDVEFYVKVTSNCAGLALTTLHELFGGAWSPARWRGEAVELITGEDMTPRFIVGWTDLYGGIACNCAIYERIGDDDPPGWAFVGGNSGLRILANMDEAADDMFADMPGADHLPPGWGVPVLLVEHADDILDESVRAALGLDDAAGIPAYDPPDWTGNAKPAGEDFAAGLILPLAEIDNPPDRAELGAVLQKLTQRDGDGLPIEITTAEAGIVLRCLPWALRDAFARWLMHAAQDAGIERPQWAALHARLLDLFGEA